MHHTLTQQSYVASIHSSVMRHVCCMCVLCGVISRANVIYEASQTSLTRVACVRVRVAVCCGVPAGPRKCTTGALLIDVFFRENRILCFFFVAVLRHLKKQWKRGIHETPCRIRGARQNAFPRIGEYYPGFPHFLAKPVKSLKNHDFCIFLCVSMTISSKLGLEKHLKNEMLKSRPNLTLFEPFCAFFLKNH